MFYARGKEEKSRHQELRMKLSALARSRKSNALAFSVDSQGRVSPTTRVLSKCNAKVHRLRARLDEADRRAQQFELDAKAPPLGCPEITR